MENLGVRLTSGFLLDRSGALRPLWCVIHGAMYFVVETAETFTTEDTGVHGRTSRQGIL